MSSASASQRSDTGNLPLFAPVKRDRIMITAMRSVAVRLQNTGDVSQQWNTCTNGLLV
jgi:hypothetical protein